MSRQTGNVTSSTRARNKEAREFAKRIIDDPDYKQRLLERARNGALPPQIEQLLYYYAFGKPVESVSLEVASSGTDLSNLTEEQLADRAELLAKALRSVNAQRDPDPPEPPKPLIH